MSSKTHKHTNSLAKENSPYLLQHAHNPVNWFAWNEETLNKAKAENKLILVSIGYSACHWCHVMEHESFEDEEVAALMNEHFINIKVDREERPDIDQVYMSAVQIMTGHGGWPLNCFALPDGRPIYGGTYFPKQQWKGILQNLARLWKEDKTKAEQYAAELTAGMLHVEQVERNTEEENFSIALLKQSVKNWKSRMDNELGGPNRAPKFPMPNNWLYLLRYAHITGEQDTMNQVHLTLRCMANGGIYDHVGGGFARYSTDMEWKVPHFEKMLYDNAQLISLYAEAYTQSRNEQYKTVVYETIEFIERELSNGKGGFYSALDADSEGEEGKFYVWTEEELKALITEEDYKIFAEVFSVNEKGYWEHDNYILLISSQDQASLPALAMKHGLKEKELHHKIKEWKNVLLKKRAERVGPGLDDKILCSWNALMIKALCDAWMAFGEESFRQMALSSAKFFSRTFLKNEGGIFHACKNGVPYINGFLEDIAFACDAFISLFLMSGEEHWIQKAEQLTTHAFEKFYDKHSGMFYFTSAADEALIVRKTELTDNVIPASASQMARNLYALYRINGNTHYKMTAATMLNNVKHEIGPYPSGYSNWSLLLLEMLYPCAEVAIVGKNVDEKTHSFRNHYLPYTIFALSAGPSEHSLFKNRYAEGCTLLYLCRNHSCGLPTESTEEVLAQLSNFEKTGS